MAEDDRRTSSGGLPPPPPGSWGDDGASETPPSYRSGPATGGDPGGPGHRTPGYRGPGNHGPGYRAPGYRAMTLADVLDGMFSLIKDHWRTFLLAVGGVLVPLSLLSNIVLAAIAPELIVPDFEAILDPEAAAAGQMPFDPQVFIALGVVSLLSFLITTPFTWAVCTRVAGDAVAGGHPGAGEAVRGGLRRYPAVLGIFLVMTVFFVLLMAVVGLATALAVMAVGDVGALVLIPLLLGFVVVSVWLYIRWALAIPVAVIERVGPLRSLRRSWTLTRTRFWWLLGTLLLVQIVAVLVGGIASAPFQALSLGLQSATFAAAVVVSLGSVVSGLIATPLQVNALTLLYSDRRVRAEGADLVDDGWRSAAPRR
jgi:Membrane domain of glycerophosphoryl diester phosphodiesterase